jgi:ABC-type Zn uptake system ZnuABC Zn-binding protein ZnuA
MASVGAGAAGSLSVVATTNVVADWVRNVGGDRVEVFSLVPVGGDPHAWQPGARAVARLADADLVVGVGLGLEAAWLNDLIKNVAADPSRVISLGKTADPITAAGESRGGDDAILDPHFWLDPLRAKKAVSHIAETLAVLDPEGSDLYHGNSLRYNAELDGLHIWIEGHVDLIPEGRRLLVTSHDSFRYFARRYGFQVVGSVIPGVTTEAEPSADQLARLVDLVRLHNAPALFTEPAISDRLSRTVAGETGVAVVISLYTGSFGGPGGAADTYIDMMMSDVTNIVEALR